MKKKNVLILVLVFLILLTPSYVLLIHALETSNFPERERVSEVEYRFLGSESESPENALPVRLSVDSDEVDLLYAIFAGLMPVRIPHGRTEWLFFEKKRYTSRFTDSLS